MEDEEYDSDTTVLLMDYCDELEKIDAKRRRLSSLHEMHDGSMHSEENENTAPHDVNINRAAGLSEKKNINIDKNWHISKYLATVNETNIHSNLNDPRNIPFIKNESTQIINNQKTDFVFDGDIICLDSDDDTQINETKENHAANNIIQKGGFNSNLNLLQPATINTRRATSNICERNEINMDHDDSPRQEVNQQSRIRVLKPAAINARRATTGFEENESGCNIIHKSINISNNDNIQSDKAEETKEIYYGAVSNNTTSAQLDKIIDKSVDFHVKHSQRATSAAPSNLFKTWLLSDTNPTQKMNSNNVLNVIPNKRLSFEDLDEKEIDAKRIKISEKEQKNINSIDIEVTGQTAQTLEVNKVQRDTRNEEYLVKRRDVHNADKACDEKDTNEAKNEIIADVAHDAGEFETVRENEESRKTHIDDEKVVEILNEKESHFQQIVFEALDKQDTSKVKNKQVVREVQDTQLTSIIQDQEIIIETFDKQEASEPRDVQGTNKAQDKKESDKDEQESSEVQEKQETSELCATERTHEVHDEQNLYAYKHLTRSAQDEYNFKEVHNRMEISKIPHEQALHTQETRNIEKESEPSVHDMSGTIKVRCEQKANKAYNEQEINLLEDEHTTGETNEKQGTSKLLDKTIKDKARDMQETSISQKPQDDEMTSEVNDTQKMGEKHDMQGTNKERDADEEKANKVYDEQEISNIQYDQVTSEIHDTQVARRVPEEPKIYTACNEQVISICQHTHKENTCEAHDTHETSKVNAEITNRAHHKQELNNMCYGQKTVDAHDEKNKTKSEASPVENKELILQFQIGFFSLINEYIKDFFPSSAETLHSLIQTLRADTKRGIVQTDVQYSCPKCSRVSTYSSKFNDMKHADNILADSSQKCSLCHGIRKLHTNYMTRFLTKHRVYKKEEAKSAFATKYYIKTPVDNCERNSVQEITSDITQIASEENSGEVTRKSTHILNNCKEISNKDVHVANDNEICGQNKLKCKNNDASTKNILKKRTSVESNERSAPNDPKRSKTGAEQNDAQTDNNLTMLLLPQDKDNVLATNSESVVKGIENVKNNENASFSDERSNSDASMQNSRTNNHNFTVIHCFKETGESMPERIRVTDETNISINYKLMSKGGIESDRSLKLKNLEVTRYNNKTEICDANVKPANENIPENLSYVPTSKSQTNTTNLNNDIIFKSTSDTTASKDCNNYDKLTGVANDAIEGISNDNAANALKHRACYTKLKNNSNSVDKKGKALNVHQTNKETLPAMALIQNINDGKLPACNKKKRAVLQYVCPVCTCVYEYASKLLQHLRVKHNTNRTNIPKNCIRRKCAFCNKIVRVNNYNKHVKHHHPEKYTQKYKDANLNTTNKESTDSGTVKNKNTRKCSNKTPQGPSYKYHCSTCDEIFNTDYAAKKHWKQIHSECSYRQIINKVIIGEAHTDREHKVGNDEDGRSEVRLDGQARPNNSDATSVFGSVSRPDCTFNEYECSSDINHSENEKSCDDVRITSDSSNNENGDKNETDKISNSRNKIGDEIYRRRILRKAEAKNEYSSDEVSENESNESNNDDIQFNNGNTSSGGNSEDSSDKYDSSLSTDKECTDDDSGGSNNEDSSASSSEESIISDCIDSSAESDDEMTASEFRIRNKNQHVRQLFGNEEALFINRTYEGEAKKKESEVNTQIEETCDESDDETLKPSNYAVKKRKHRLANLFGYEDEPSEFDKINRKDCDQPGQNEGDERHDSSEEKEEPSEDETIKVSKSTVKKRKERLSTLFGNENEVLVQDIINEGNEREIRSGDELYTRQEDSNNENTQIITSNIESGGRNYEDTKIYSDDDAIKPSIFTVKKRKERLTRLYGNDNEQSESDKTNAKDCDQRVRSKQYKHSDKQYRGNDEEDGPSNCAGEKIAINEESKYIFLRKKELRKRVGCGNEASHRNNIKKTNNEKPTAGDNNTEEVIEICGESNRIHVGKPENREGGNNNEILPNVTDHQKKSKEASAMTDRNDDRTEIDMFDDLLDGYNSQTSQRCNDDQPNASEVSNDNILEIDDQSYTQSVEAKTCLDNIQITKVTSITDKIYVYICQECHYATDTYDNVIRHCQNHYNRIQDPVTYCNICQIKYDTSCFGRHTLSHDNYLEIIKIKFSYQWLFSNWQAVFENKGVSLKIAEDVQMKSIYKTFCLKMTVDKDGPWQSALYLCAKCETCVSPQDVETHVKEKCSLGNYPCSLCDRVFLTYDMREHHKIYHKDSNQLFKVIVFNEKNDENFNLQLIEAKAQNESVRAVDIFKCLCGLCFMSLKNLKLHFFDCESSTNSGLECPHCNLSLQFTPKELEYHQTFHNTLKYEFRVQKITFQEENNCHDSSERETITQTLDNKENIHVPYNIEDLIIKRDMLKEESTQDSHEIGEDNIQREFQYADRNIIEEELKIKRELLKEEALSQEVTEVEDK